MSVSISDSASICYVCLSPCLSSPFCLHLSVSMSVTVCFSCTALFPGLSLSVPSFSHSPSFYLIRFAPCLLLGSNDHFHSLYHAHSHEPSRPSHPNVWAHVAKPSLTNIFCLSVNLPVSLSPFLPPTLPPLLPLPPLHAAITPSYSRSRHRRCPLDGGGGDSAAKQRRRKQPPYP